MCSLTTYVLATREGGSIEYSWEDENGGQGDLGVRDEPLTMAEAIEMIDAVLLAQEGYTGGDWRDVYLCDETMVVTVSSESYPQLREWYETAIAEWRAAHPVEE